MAKSAGPAILLGGALALILMSRKKEVGQNGAIGPVGEGDEFDDDEPPIDVNGSYEHLVAEWEGPEGRPVIGRFYQVKEGDSILAVAREAIFGSRDPRLEAWERQVVSDYSIRIDCSPWNQTLYGKDASMLQPGHRAVENGWSKIGVSFSPSFQDNRALMSQGAKPTSSSGGGHPYIWLPMIDLEALETDRTVTTMGQNWPDDGGGEYNKICPPPWAVDLQFENVAVGQVGCNLPEGDFRKTLERT